GGSAPGDAGTGGSAPGDAGTGGAAPGDGGGDQDGGGGSDAATPVECDSSQQDNDGDGVCSDTCATLGCVFGTCADSSGTAKCTCDALHQGTLCDELVPPPQDGLVLWLDAQNAGTLTLTGDASFQRVSDWRDVNDAAKVLTQTGASSMRPRYLADGLGGLPAVTFDGLDDYLELLDFTGLKNAASYDIYFVGSAASSSESGVVLAGVNGESGTAGAGEHGLLLQVNSTANGFRFNHRMPFAASGGLDLTTPSDLDLTRLTPYRFSASEPNGRLTSSDDATSTGTVLGQVLAFNRNLDLTVGRLSVTQAQRHLKGAIGEILVYDTQQLSISSAKIRSYLKAHWPTVQ
ncbi:MAG: hypothetical protein FJ034_08895, partial [Chloroflexi bacterium]|nr:hypothetical protein [Chloroflexota bacterium]